ncbi:RNA polymerase sigma factor [Roseofilum capinflatum]|uniref:RNA polymerase sigma factor n=1 Tax=Roseofilum capinflatum BLCC-M114 TaxID=3022440 RepID=A0ABT7B642_9CYAN|nr:RNA polymerase sigma factor [Roseofilum capinflatum]MDJ1174642.1 RNA polymerase sigma factor [Roseofilum capinflatum BLCC-M114]
MKMLENSPVNCGDRPHPDKLCKKKHIWFWREWKKHRDGLYYCCLKWMGGNVMDAEDALSESMLKAWKKMGDNPENIYNFKSYLYKTTHHVCIDMQRKKNRSKNKIVSFDRLDEARILSPMQEHRNMSLEEAEARKMIEKAIQSLPDRIRETFILHYYGALSYKEIAEKQELSYTNVRKRVSEGRLMLTEKLRMYFLD